MCSLADNWDRPNLGMPLPEHTLVRAYIYCKKFQICKIIYHINFLTLYFSPFVPILTNRWRSGHGIPETSCWVGYRQFSVELVLDPMHQSGKFDYRIIVSFQQIFGLGTKFLLPLQSGIHLDFRNYLNLKKSRYKILNFNILPFLELFFEAASKKIKIKLK